MIDARRDQLALAVEQAAAALDAHRRDCSDCSTAKAARQPRLMCSPGWHLFTARRDADAEQAAYVQELRRQADAWPTLFDLPA